MPGLSHKSLHFNHPSSLSSTAGSVADPHRGIWSSSYRDGVTMSQLRKFWSELSSAARHDLLRIDKQALFEQVRKNLYCSRCNGLLLEGFSQIILHGKNLQGGSLFHGDCSVRCHKSKCEPRDKPAVTNFQDDVRDPSVHPWGGLTATRDSMLTLLDCFLDGQPLEVIQNVFDSARARERERELLYPDACGGGGRGWISQGSSSSCSGRGHSLKETCALHTARLSCDALVDFWSALGEETRRSLLRMKEEDFIERLMFRFDSKRFCRDCRRNVLREFKEMKELKRTRKEPRCTRWFCTADTAFRYEVSNTSVQVNWRECFGGDICSIYRHFEWGLGSAEGNCDILDFEDVGLSEGARVDGLDLGHVHAFYITLRAWKHDGRCTEVSVKAHALKGRQCVHRRLIVGDGYVTITKGESIKRFFEHAEEAEEEEDDDGMDKDGSELESEASRFQKHAKSPELARDFLLDAAAIIFKEQVEKAFREGTARQNAHTIFVCLALGLLEERIHVACKEISTLEKQNKLLEEEEHERREEEQRRERKRIKEKEKKMRRKEKLRERDKEKDMGDTKLSCNVGAECGSGTACQTSEDVCSNDQAKELSRVDVMIDDIMAQPSSPDTIEARSSAEGNHDPSVSMDDVQYTQSDCRKGNGAFTVEHSKAARRRSKIRKGPFMETVSGRLARRSFLIACESGGPSSRCVQLQCTSVREMTEQSLQGPQRHNKGLYNSEKIAWPRWVEGWNRRSQQRQVTKPNSASTISLKSRQHDTGWMGKRTGKDFFIIKKGERENGMGGSKRVYSSETCIPGSQQCNLEATTAKSWTSDGEVRMAGSGLQPATHTGVSSETFNTNEVSPVMLHVIKEDMTNSYLIGNCSTTSGTHLNVSMSAGQHYPVCGSDESVTCLGSEKLQCNLESSECPLEELELFTGPSAELDYFGNEESICRTAPHYQGVVDEDLSPSATSCVTDTSENFTIDSMTTESAPCLEARSPSQMSVAVPSQLKDGLQEDTHTSNDGLPTNALNHSGDYHAFRASEDLPCPDFHAYPSSSNLLAYSHWHPCGTGPSKIGMVPEIQPVDVAQETSLMDFSVQLPLLSVPLHPPHYSWTPGQCAPFLSPALLPFPRTGSLMLASRPGGFGPSTGSLPIALRPLQPAFQPVWPVLGFSCLSTVEANFVHHRDQHIISKDEANTDATKIENTSGQTASSFQEWGCAKEQFDCSGSKDAAQTFTSQINDVSGFSLFHFGGPARVREDKQEPSISASSEENTSDNLKHLPCKTMQPEDVGITRIDLPVEEYSLFASSAGNRFGFF